MHNSYCCGLLIHMCLDFAGDISIEHYFVLFLTCAWNWLSGVTAPWTLFVGAAQWMQVEWCLSVLLAWHSYSCSPKSLFLNMVAIVVYHCLVCCHDLCIDSNLFHYWNVVLASSFWWISSTVIIHTVLKTFYTTIVFVCLFLFIQQCSNLSLIVNLFCFI